MSQEDSRAARVIEDVRAKWGALNILNEGAPRSQIAAFERKHRVSLPPAVRLYFQELNGTYTGALGMEDDHLFGFWHLDQIKTFEQEDQPGEAAERSFVIADHSLWAHAFAIQLCADAAKPAPIVTDVGAPHFQRVADSLVAFLEHYLANNVSVLYPSPDAAV
jgi:hypothetical protein